MWLVWQRAGRGKGVGAPLRRLERALCSPVHCDARATLRTPLAVRRAPAPAHRERGLVPDLARAVDIEVLPVDSCPAVYRPRRPKSSPLYPFEHGFARIFCDACKSEYLLEAREHMLNERNQRIRNQVGHSVWAPFEVGGYEKRPTAASG